MGDTADSTHVQPGAHVHRGFLQGPPRLGGCWRVRAGWKTPAKAMGICHLEVGLENSSSPAREEDREAGGRAGRAWGGEPRVTHAGSRVRSGLEHTGRSAFPGSWACTRTSPPGGLCDRRCLPSRRRSSRSLE